MDYRNIDHIQSDVKITADHLNELKKRGEKQKMSSVDGLLSYCDTVDCLCKKVKELEKENKILKQRVKDNTWNV